MNLDQPTCCVDIDDTVNLHDLRHRVSLRDIHRHGFDATAMAPKEGVAHLGKVLRTVRSMGFRIAIISGANLRDQRAYASKMGLGNDYYLADKRFDTLLRPNEIDELLFQSSRSGLIIPKHNHFDQFGIDPKRAFLIQDQPGSYESSSDFRYFQERGLGEHLVPVGKLQSWHRSIEGDHQYFARPGNLPPHLSPTDLANPTYLPDRNEAPALDRVKTTATLVMAKIKAAEALTTEEVANSDNDFSVRSVQVAAR